MNIVKLEMNIIIRHTQPDPLEHPGVNATMEMHNNQPSQAALLPCLTKKLTEAKNKTQYTHTPGSSCTLPPSSSAEGDTQLGCAL